MAAQRRSAAMLESATASEARAPVTTIAALTAVAALTAIASIFAPMVPRLFTPVLVKTTMVAKIMLRRLTTEHAVAGTHSVTTAVTTAVAASARSGIDMGQSEPKHNRSAGGESFSKKHPATHA